MTPTKHAIASPTKSTKRSEIAGYETRLIFVALDNPETAIRRVAIRVAQGGHDIPEEMIRRRFFRGLRNFFDMYCQEVDHWTLLDNSGDCWKIIAVKKGKTEQRIFDADVWQNLERKSRYDT